MSSHSSPSHGHSGGNSFFDTAKSWLASAPVTHRNSLSAVDAIGHELTEATVKTTTGYVANILNPLETAAQHALALVSPSAYHAHGWKTIPQGVWWAIANTGKSAANIITGIPHALHHTVQHGLNNTVVEASNGTLDRIPFFGKFLGNIPKLASWAFNAPFTFGSWLMKKIPDRLMDGLAKGWLYQSKERHLTGWHEVAHQWGHH
jgi:hypothetical protein